MGERGRRGFAEGEAMRAVLIAAALTALGFSGDGPLSAAPVAALSPQAGPPAGYLLAQAKPARRPPHVTVTPREPAVRLYPSPNLYDYPGPGYVRQCTSWLAQEARPSGTVVVPRMRCWWVRG
jgi:hypothetical protein